MLLPHPFPNDQLCVLNRSTMPLNTGLFICLFLFTLQVTTIKGKPSLTPGSLQWHLVVAGGCLDAVMEFK